MVDFDRGLRDDGVGAYSFWKPYPGGTIITYKALLENGETIEGKMSKSQFEKEYRGET